MTAATSSADEPFDEEPPPSFVFLWTPSEAVHERIAIDDLATFVGAVVDLTAEYVATTRFPTLDELQVGCGLVPGPRLLYEVKTVPADESLVHTRELGRRIQQLSVPSVRNAPVVFARRLRRDGVRDSQSFSVPFASYATNEPKHLDRIVMEAAGASLISASPPATSVSASWWQRTKSFFLGPPASAPPQDVTSALANRIRLPVVAWQCHVTLQANASPTP